MKRIVFAVAVAASLSSAPVFAEEAADKGGEKKPEPKKEEPKKAKPTWPPPGNKA